MGCMPSKIDGDESVARCKERKQFMKTALTARNAFAAAHSSYAMALKNTGAALSDYGQGEIHDLRPASSALPSSSSAFTAAAVGQASSSSSAAVGTASSSVQAPVDKLPPPPPPLPADLSAEAPLQRSVSMPGLPISTNLRKMSTQDSAIIEEDDFEVSTDEADAANSNSTATAVPPAPPVLPKPSESRPLPRPLPNENTWEYFNVFNTDHISFLLGQPEDVTPDREVEKLANIETAPAATVNDPQAVAQAPVVVEKVVAEAPSAQQKPARKSRPGSGASHHHRTGSSGGEAKRGRMAAAVTQSVSFLQILNELDDHFLKASQSAYEVSKMLEATRLHYHSNFADNRGHIDHSEKIMKVITWNRSIKGMCKEDDPKDVLDDKNWGTHATILDKMLAWEKKLYDEVKAGELMKIEYQKISLLNRKKKKGAETESLEKLKSNSEPFAYEIHS
ncbi:hypothetical protein HPP92_016592 [Vanilla planifolia]|uniref:DUF630 domain-containing protein n=1 Tax=Vanilla planifolia TaxID=51239 RepID=A0A835UUC7_VANPL|nr:hypothetical protein HPP92_016592 [Vanilla planifolia]